MWIVPYILPVLTVVSLFFYILSAERAWLPKAGTTEWITRATTRKLMSASIKPEFKFRDIFIFIAIAGVYAGVLIITNFTTFSQNIPATVCTALFVGIVYLTAHLLFKNRVTAFLAAVFTAADYFLVKTFAAEGTALVLITIFVFFVLMASDKPASLIPAGLVLVTAAFMEPALGIFTVLALMGAIVSCVRCKSGKPILMYALLGLILPTAVYCGLSYFIYGHILISRIMTSFTPPVFFNISYCAIAAVCLIVSVIHIFKDKSFNALFISAGLIISASLMFTGYNLIPLFAGFVLAYPSGIIVQRGGRFHKAWCIVFAIVISVPVLYYTVISFIEAFFPNIVLF